MRLGKVNWFWPVAVTVLGYCFAVGLVCRHYHVYSWRGWQVYKAMEHECHPVWRDYNFGRVKAGDDVEEVIARTRPTTVKRQGRRVELEYGAGGFTGVSAVAYEGKLVLACAWSCGWVRVFFDEMTDAQSMDYLKRHRDEPERFGIVPVYR